MRDRNSISDTWFIVLNGLVAFFAMIIFNRFFSNVSPVMDLSIYRWLQTSITILFVTWSAYFCCQYRRNWVSIMTNATSLCAILFILRCFSYSYPRIMIATGVCVLLSWVYARTVFRQSRDGRRTRENARRYTVHAVKNLFAICLITAMIIPAGGGSPWKLLDPQPAYGQGMEAEAVTWSEEKSLKRNMDVISTFDPEIFKTLSEEGRRNAVQVAHRVEANYLGVREVEIIVDEDMKERDLGYYSDEAKEIHINREHLLYDEAEDVLNTVLHETRHEYQYALIHLYKGIPEEDRGVMLLREAHIDSFDKEFRSYISGTKDEQGYYAQFCEQDAREWAEHGVKEYYKAIEEAKRASN